MAGQEDLGLEQEKSKDRGIGSGTIRPNKEI